MCYSYVSRNNCLYKKGAHLGHGCIIHGAIIGENSLIGMNSVIMDDAVIGNECIVGALTLVKSEMNIPNRKIIIGNPGKIVKDVSDEMLIWKKEGTKLYQKLPNDCLNSLKKCNPNTKKIAPKNQNQEYKTWKKTKNKTYKKLFFFIHSSLYILPTYLLPES